MLHTGSNIHHMLTNNISEMGVYERRLLEIVKGNDVIHSFIWMLGTLGFNFYINSDADCKNKSGWDIFFFQKKFKKDALEEYGLNDYLCQSNDNFYLNVKLAVITWQESSLPTSMSVEFETCGCTKNDHWVKVEAYGVRVERAFNEYSNIVDKMVGAWKVLYGM